MANSDIYEALSHNITFENSYYNNQTERPSWHIDYLTVTIWAHDYDDLVDFVNFCLKGVFTDLQDKGHGGRFYQSTYKTDLSVTLRLDPIGQENENRATLELPGQACQLLGFDKLRDLLLTFTDYFPKIRINRIDTAFNNVPFSVQDVERCILDDNLRSYAKRDSLKIFKQPYEQVTDHNGQVVQVGTSGLYFGSRTSTRMIRVYDRHGYTRLECEYKHDKAHQVGLDLLLSDNTDTALRLAVGHLRDYIDFFADWWDLFMDNFDRLYKTLPQNIQELTVDQIKQWFERQISAAFYVMATLQGQQYLTYLYNQGSVAYERSRYKGIIEMECKE